MGGRLLCLVGVLLFSGGWGRRCRRHGGPKDVTWEAGIVPNGGAVEMVGVGGSAEVEEVCHGSHVVVVEFGEGGLEVWHFEEWLPVAFRR